MDRGEQRGLGSGQVAGARCPLSKRSVGLVGPAVSSSCRARSMTTACNSGNSSLLPVERASRASPRGRSLGTAGRSPSHGSYDARLALRLRASPGSVPARMPVVQCWQQGHDDRECRVCLIALASGGSGPGAHPRHGVWWVWPVVVGAFGGQDVIASGAVRLGRRGRLGELAACLFVHALAAATGSTPISPISGWPPVSRPRTRFSARGPAGVRRRG